MTGQRHHQTRQFRLTGKEGGRTMCLGELFSVPTAMRAFTGMVNIWDRNRETLSKGER